MVERAWPELEHGRGEIFEFVKKLRGPLLMKLNMSDMTNPIDFLGACAWAIELWEADRIGFDLTKTEGIQACSKAFHDSYRGDRDD